ncbi:FKBP-type peptidyl-prolyl cis-trans isomerase [Phycicoccus endophyticus]|uniref:Peptidyl-prolyl cis-trans isomerase n=1 Tax=Phycicoccus endophyticus TaxID=1690220 RepID=A0A7G9R4J3_9MICO|nr:FKBP-type peptidyl-prolyl cis-trans isomerase [Phycicoccus endophyticus]NHI18408.1 FKBP-type peptidylprolyl isomerase [Phycicoccus endophyticus]QNN50518.1 FKBP-type peptidyl-prolyl cis-trans isomerase [Phycicoccus endophyticus]GGL24060.1 peptidylprolyl isomerase [Phycicoccus endophyticus]
MPRRFLPALSAAALAGTLLLAGCGSDEAATPTSSLSSVQVTGAADKEPTVTVDAPLELSRTESTVVSEGDGATIADDDLVTLKAVLVNGTDGKVITSTWGSGTVGLDLAADDLFASFKSEIPGTKVGSRMVIASTPADAYGDSGNETLGIGADDPVVFVVDLVDATQALASAEGTAVTPKKGLPTVTVKDGEPAKITIPKGAKAPKNTVAQTLVKGTGEKVTEGQTIRVSYTGALLRNGKVFDASANHPDDPTYDFTVGQGQVVTGWDTGLRGQTVGSRVLLIVPPKDGYGDSGRGDTIKGTDTLVFVVDILAAY